MDEATRLEINRIYEKIEKQCDVCPPSIEFREWKRNHEKEHGDMKDIRIRKSDRVLVIIGLFVSMAMSCANAIMSFLKK